MKKEKAKEKHNQLQLEHRSNDTHAAKSAILSNQDIEETEDMTEEESETESESDSTDNDDDSKPVGAGVEVNGEENVEVKVKLTDDEIKLRKKLKAKARRKKQQQKRRAKMRELRKTEDNNEDIETSPSKKKRFYNPNSTKNKKSAEEIAKYKKRYKDKQRKAKKAQTGKVEIKVDKM